MKHQIDTKSLGGIYPALLTPFHPSGINQQALRELIEYNIRKGVTGFYVCGSSAEVFLLTEQERMSLYEIVAEQAAGRVRLIAQVGSISTQQAIGYAKRAKELGYDAVSAVSPFYYGFRFAEIKQYYQSIMAASEMPMIMYHVPCTSKVSFSFDEIAEILSLDGVIGLKYTSNDFFTLELLKARFPEKIIFNGFDEMFLCGLSMGADGAIGSTFNFMAETFIRIRQSYEEGKPKEALALQSEANRIIHVLVECGVMQANKEILCQLGFDFGSPRPPFAELTPVQKQRLHDEVTSRL